MHQQNKALVVGVCLALLAPALVSCTSGELAACATGSVREQILGLSQLLDGSGRLTALIEKTLQQQAEKLPAPDQKASESALVESLALPDSPSASPAAPVAELGSSMQPEILTGSSSTAAPSAPEAEAPKGSVAPSTTTAASSSAGSPGAAQAAPEVKAELRNVTVEVILQVAPDSRTEELINNPDAVVASQAAQQSAEQPAASSAAPSVPSSTSAGAAVEASSSSPATPASAGPQTERPAPAAASQELALASAAPLSSTTAAPPTTQSAPAAEKPSSGRRRRRRSAEAASNATSIVASSEPASAVSTSSSATPTTTAASLSSSGAPPSSSVVEPSKTEAASSTTAAPSSTVSASSTSAASSATSGPTSAASSPTSELASMKQGAPLAAAASAPVTVEVSAKDSTSQLAESAPKQEVVTLEIVAAGQSAPAASSTPAPASNSSSVEPVEKPTEACFGRDSDKTVNIEHLLLETARAHASAPNDGNSNQPAGAPSNSTSGAGDLSLADNSNVIYDTDTALLAGQSYATTAAPRAPGDPKRQTLAAAAAAAAANSKFVHVDQTDEWATAEDYATCQLKESAGNSFAAGLVGRLNFWQPAQARGAIHLLARFRYARRAARAKRESFRALVAVNGTPMAGAAGEPALAVSHSIWLEAAAAPEGCHANSSAPGADGPLLVARVTGQQAAGGAPEVEVDAELARGELSLSATSAAGAVNIVNRYLSLRAPHGEQIACCRVKSSDRLVPSELDNNQAAGNGSQEPVGGLQSTPVV